MIPYKTLTAMLSVTWLMTWALYLGINGTLLAAAIAALAGLGGYELKAVLSTRGKNGGS